MVVLKSLFILLLLSSAFSKSEVDKKCSEINSGLNKNEIHCLGISDLTTSEADFSSIEDISEPIQEWLWLTDKVFATIEADKEKMTFLEDVESSFAKASNGFSGAAEKDVQRVLEYNSKFEELLNLVNQESFLTHALNVTCPKIRCNDDRRNDFRVRIADVQSKKISILMRYPLLSNEGIRDTLEEESEKYIDRIQNGKSGTVKDFERDQINRLRKSFPKIMSEGIKVTKNALTKRIDKWKEFNDENAKNAKDEINFLSGHRKKGLVEKIFTSHDEQTDDLQRDNSLIVNELISNTNIDDEMNNPYIGRAICNINQRNRDQLNIEDRNKLIVDTALFVAPFFLGPIGAGIRLLGVGRLAAWGVRGDLLGTAALEATILSKDISDLGDQIEKCNGLQLQTLKKTENRDIAKNDEYNMNSVSSCQDELQTQTLMTMGGALLGGGALLRYTKYGSPSAFSSEAKAIIDKFRNSKTQIKLKNTLKGENLSDADLNKVLEEFDTFKKSKKFKNDDEALVAFKVEYNKKYSVNSSCTI